jgi:hypothetical protein
MGSFIVTLCIIPDNINQLVYQITKFILLYISCKSMPHISEEDFRALELKIHAEIHAIFSQVMEDSKNKTGNLAGTVPAQEQKKSGPPFTSGPVETDQDSAGLRRKRRPKKSIDINKILHTTPNAARNSPGNILNSDLEKIFGKKRSRG